MQNALQKKRLGGDDRKTQNCCCVTANRACSVSRMTGSFPITRDGHSWSTKARSLSLESLDPAAVFEQLFESNGWGDSWRDGIYNYDHYHSRTHEVLGIARGSGKVQFGGLKGRTIVLKAGDVAILPAGTGHQCLKASDDFLVVGAYPATGTYDECTSFEDRKKALISVPKTARPRKDPVYGKDGPLLRAWRKISRVRR